MSNGVWKKYSDKAARSLGCMRLIPIQAFHSEGKIHIICSDGKPRPKRMLLTLTKKEVKALGTLSHTFERPPEATRSQVRNLLYHGMVDENWRNKEDRNAS